MTLFKYCTPQTGRIILEKQTLRFSPVSAFNDPFDSMAGTGILDTPEFRQQLIDTRIKEQFEPLASANPGVTSDRPSATFTPPNQFRIPEESVFSKSFYWKYEQEYRLLRTQTDTDLGKTPCDSLLRLPSDLLVSVTFGLNTPTVPRGGVSLMVPDSRRLGNGRRAMDDGGRDEGRGMKDEGRKTEDGGRRC